MNKEISWENSKNFPKVNSDNFKIKVSSNQKQHLKNAILMCFDAEVIYIETYKIIDEKILILENKYDSKSNKLPYKLNADMSVEFVWNWLTYFAKWEKEPDHDGSNSLGFTVENGNNEIIIKTEWMWHGK